MFTCAKDISLPIPPVSWGSMSLLEVTQDPLLNSGTCKEAVTVWTITGRAEMRWNTHREPIQPNSTTAAVICWQEALSGKISTWKCLQSLWMVFKQDANGSLTSCQICHILYYKAWTKITYALAGRGFPVVMQGKRVEYWAIFDISILLLAVALGHISAQETLHCHRGGWKRRRREQRWKREYGGKDTHGLRGVKAVTEWQQSESSSNSIFLLQASSLMADR